MALDVNSKIFMIHITIQKQEKMLVYFKKQAKIRALLFNKALIKIPVKYFNYNNVFLVENRVKFQKIPK